MRSVYINEEIISKCFWEVIYQHIRYSPDIAVHSAEILETTRNIQTAFPYGLAGSIDRRAIEELIAIARYFSPRRACEVGTYIGRSALSIIAGSNDSLVEYNTCDYSFDQFQLPRKSVEQFSLRSKIKYYPKKSSTEMFESISSLVQSPSIDFFYIDGRLGSKDVGLIRQLMTEDAVFVLDDFEGVEKGVVNALTLSTQLKGLILVRPSSPLIGSGFAGKTALLIPSTLLRVTKQQLFPYSM
jgi:predicted O-methyltransferase YrrM